MRVLFGVLGFVFLAVGIIGIFVPLLPTTPFLLLAAFCFNRSSPRFHEWLISHPWFGPPIRDWNQNQVIRPRYKILATAMMLISVFYLFLRPTIPVAGKISVGLLIGGLLVFIWTRKSKVAT